MNWRELIAWSSGDGAALSNTTTATSLLPAAAKITLAPAYLRLIGAQRLRLRAAGRISTVVTSPGTMNLDMRFGATVVFDSGAMTLNVVAKTNVGWILDAEGELRVVGASAQLFTQGLWFSEAVIGNALPTVGGAAPHVLPYNAAPAVGNAFDSQASQVVDFFGKWSTANGSNSIQCHSFSLEALVSGL